MAKTSYPIVIQKPITTAQVNPTYNGKEIPSEITTTGGEYLQSEQSLKKSLLKDEQKPDSEDL